MSLSAQSGSAAGRAAVTTELGGGVMRPGRTAAVPLGEVTGITHVTTWLVSGKLPRPAERGPLPAGPWASTAADPRGNQVIGAVPARGKTAAVRALTVRSVTTERA